MPAGDKQHVRSHACHAGRPGPRAAPAAYRWLANWRERHQHPLSRRLHYVGIPLTVAALFLAGVQLAQWRWDLWWRPTLLLAVGYMLQYIGHRLEGNDMGEVILCKRLLGRPYRAIGSNTAGRKPSDCGAAHRP